MIRYTLDFRDEHCAEIASICTAFGMDPVHLIATVFAESGWRPYAANPGSSALGLIQWMKGDKGLYAGRYTQTQLVAIGLAGQLKLVRERYSKFDGHLSRLGDVYAVVAAPAAVGVNLDEPIYLRSGATRFSQGKDTAKMYAANYPHWDLTDTGAVTLKSLALWARVKAEGERFHELVSRVTSKPCSWPDLSKTETIGTLLGNLGFSSVRAYQESRGLSVDGVVGPRTKARIVLDSNELF